MDVEERKRSRYLSSPTGVTPKQNEKCQRSGEQVKGRKRLDLAFSDVASTSINDNVNVPVSSVIASNLQWTEDEDKALVEFILLSRPGDNWPQTKKMDYWSSAALFIHHRCSLPIRTCK